MDVKGAKALSERLAEAARNVDPPPAKAVDSGDTDRGVRGRRHCGEGVTAASTQRVPFDSPLASLRPPKGPRSGGPLLRVHIDDDAHPSTSARSVRLNPRSDGERHRQPRHAEE